MDTRPVQKDSSAVSWLITFRCAACSTLLIGTGGRPASSAVRRPGRGTAPGPVRPRGVPPGRRPSRPGARTGVAAEDVPPVVAVLVGCQGASSAAMKSAYRTAAGRAAARGTPARASPGRRPRRSPSAASGGSSPRATGWHSVSVSHQLPSSLGVPGDTGSAGPGQIEELGPLLGTKCAQGAVDRGGVQAGRSRPPTGHAPGRVWTSCSGTASPPGRTRCAGSRGGRHGRGRAPAGRRRVERPVVGIPEAGDVVVALRPSSASISTTMPSCIWASG